MTAEISFIKRGAMDFLCSKISSQPPSREHGFALPPRIRHKLKPFSQTVIRSHFLISNWWHGGLLSCPYPLVCDQVHNPQWSIYLANLSRDLHASEKFNSQAVV